MAGSSDPATISASISYKDAKANYSLVVGVFDLNSTPSAIVPGIAISSPDPCVNQPILVGLCVISLSGPSGVENVEFKIGGILGGPQGIGNWNLNMTAALLDANRTLLENSVSSATFTIVLTPIMLAITVPSFATVTVDGVKQHPGSVQVPLAPGTHNITVPTIAQVDEVTRLRFDHWADGPGQSNRTVDLTSSGSLEAVYVTQYRLDITDQTMAATGAGWYDAGMTLQFTVPITEQMPGLLGSLGGKLNFQAWYENGKLLSDSPIDTITMNGPHSLTVQWQADYTTPMIIFTITIVAALALAYLIIRRSHGAAPSETAIGMKETKRRFPESRTAGETSSRRTRSKRGRRSSSARRRPR